MFSLFSWRSRGRARLALFPESGVRRQHWIWLAVALTSTGGSGNERLSGPEGRTEALVLLDSPSGLSHVGHWERPFHRSESLGAEMLALCSSQRVQRPKGRTEESCGCTHRVRTSNLVIFECPVCPESIVVVRWFTTEAVRVMGETGTRWLDPNDGCNPIVKTESMQCGRIASLTTTWAWLRCKQRGASHCVAQADGEWGWR